MIKYDTYIECLPIAIFITISAIIALLLLIINQVCSLITKNNTINKSKNDSFECGFKENENSRIKFNIRYYLIGILFLIFDLEMAFIIPWSVISKSLSKEGLISMIIFLIILTIGFLYEWNKGALEWD